jgi:hypothetical protein
MGPSINDVTALGGRGYQGFCNNSTKALLIKTVMMGGGGVKNYQKLRDVIFERPQCVKKCGEWIFSFATNGANVKLMLDIAGLK